MKKDGTRDKRRQYLGCLDNIWGKCKACFPRPTFPEAAVDMLTGALTVKKLEPWMNTVTPVIITFSVATLMSQVSGLKTWTIFEAIKTVLQKGVQIIGSSLSRHEKACQLMTKLVNNIGTKMELGSPMISMYLLGNPDHYTSHKFTPFYWTQFVQEAMSAWTVPSEHAPPADLLSNNKIVIIKKNNRVIGLSPVYDYMFRSTALNNMDLFTWISHCNRIKRKATPAAQRDVVNEMFSIEDSGLPEQKEDDKLERPDHSKSHTLMFTNEHPLFASHATRCVAPDDVKGDREYYCATMLTFFKPWRSGCDLKAADESWDDAFVTYSQDDFHAQMRNSPSSWDVDTCKNLDQSPHVLEDGETETLVEEIEVSDVIGARERKRRNALAVMTGIMQRLWWEKPKLDGVGLKEKPQAKPIEVFA
ncbi:hypothetical protein JOM56_013488 [Amanita muscaria]